MRNPTFTFDFEELPLVIENGFEAGELIAGSAEISYNRDGEWNIEGIFLEGSKRLRWSVEQHFVAAKENRFLPAYEKKNIELDAGTPLYLTIYHRLEHEWSDRVHDAVQEQIASDREDAAQYRAEARREERMLGGAA